ncbi:hypothetical protein FRX31_028508 [Thalictrum thalictroides]|uniref:Uncharacterized protein n=1 Tax=Thalictrum thalictroides TaxID=46969 RepID=A0A7J6V9Y6_THATH|nr:hypothetical protein FRX31_028508 [Thalictrum thalictroides]
MQRTTSSGSALVKLFDNNIDRVVAVNCGPPSPRKQAIKRVRDDEDLSFKKKELETKQQKICCETEIESNPRVTSYEKEISSIMDSESSHHAYIVQEHIPTRESTRKRGAFDDHILEVQVLAIGS